MNAKEKRESFLKDAQESDNFKKINEWLDRIGEYDKACRDEVINSCRDDKEAMNYYLSRCAEK